ncbi:E-selectin-like isoform X2 [Branchiostoma lanceolatum]|uniref:E-selectin-like isoform X2 n=1 Tax=Branchiostoma lanceolatum TaxID=7740 RepID=UPI003456BDDF
MEVIGSAIMPTEFNCDPLISARYVSVHIVHFRQMLLCEVEVYVTDICCDDAIAVLNGQITASNGFCSGNDAQFSCDPGYELVGRSTVTCQGNGSWDGEIPTCERVCCDNTTEVMNGQVNATDGYCFGDDIQFSCDPGHELVGRSNATCQEDGSWGRELPTCQRICCDDTIEILNGQITASNGFCSGNDAQFSCDPGYELVGRSTVTCQEDRRWDGEIPTCRLHTEESSTSNGAIVGAIFGGAFAVVVVVVVVVAVRRRRTKRGSQEYAEMENITGE